MITGKFRVLIVLLAGFVLPACGPSQAELDATATRVAADIFATQTAQAPTATPTSTNTPTFTPSPTPTATPTVTPSPTGTPTITPTPTPHLLAAALTLEDLPAGFIPVSADDLGDMQAGIPENALAFGYGDETRLQTIVGILFPLTDRVKQTIFDQTLPQYADVYAAAFGATSTPEPLTGLDEIGETRVGFTFLADIMSVSMRWDAVLFRRGEVAEMLFVGYPEGDAPAVPVADLARLLDERLTSLLEAGG